jgi:hypothetical protein
LKGHTNQKVIKIKDEIEVNVSRDFSFSFHKIAIYVGYSKELEVTQNDRKIINDLLLQGFQVVFVKATDSQKRFLDWGEEDFLSSNLITVTRGNFGYDFGSWALALNKFPEIRKFKSVLFMNDSLLGPLFDSSPFFAHFENSSCDVWGATINNEFFPHIQTYLLGFKNQVLLDKPLRHFWRDIRVQKDKESVVHKYELGFSKLLYSESYSFETAFVSEMILDYDKNPTLFGWERLLELDFPYIKKMMINNPELGHDGYRIPFHIKKNYGIEVGELL